MATSSRRSPSPSISTRTLQRIYAGGFLSHIVTLDVDGQKQRVLPRDYQLDPVKDLPLHTSISCARRRQYTPQRRVHVHFVNELESPGLKRGGTLNIVRHTVELSSPADSIPEEITVDLTGLDINDSVHINSVKLPEGVRPTITDRNFTIATVVAPSGMRSEEATADAAPEAAAAPAANAKPAADAKAAPAKK